MAVADWDFGDANWGLSAVQYVSAPTAITGELPYCRRILCRVAESLVLPEGRIVTQLYQADTYALQLVFRHQSALGDASLQDCYMASFPSTGNIWLRYRLTGATAGIDFWPVSCTTNTWERWRLTWWNGVDMMNNPALAVRLERYEAGAWVSYGEIYDTNNRWKDSALNRCGLGILSTNTWIDDTKIWIPL